MKVSIITATYNSEKNIKECLNSVALQSYKNIEHIVIDGGSTDQTLNIIKTTPSVSNWISEQDSGIYHALNKGIQMATGEIIGFLHSDDILAKTTTMETIINAFCSPKNLQKQRSITDNEEIGQNNIEYKIHGIYGNLVFTDTQNINKIVRTWKSRPFNRKNLQFGWAPPHPTLFLKKEVYKKHGLFDESFKIAGDYEFMLRVMKDKTINLICIREVITKMRMGGVSTGNIIQLITKSKEDMRALRNNNFNFPLYTLFLKKIHKLPQLVNRTNSIL